MKNKIVTFIAFFSLLVAALCGAKAYSTRAVLNPSDGEYISDFATAEIAVEIWENGESVEGKDLFSGIDEIDPGKAYPEVITVKNTSENPEYVRVVVRKYWNDAEGNKVSTLSPSLIKLPVAGSSWFENSEERTKERSVYYLRNALEGNAESAALFETLTIDKSVAKTYTVSVSEDGNTKTVVYTYDNDNVSFVVEMEAQSLQVPQEDNAAVTSVWGVTNIQAADGVLSLQ